MRYYLTFLLFLLQITVLFSQFTDDFTDGNFTAAPPWAGNTADFTVTSGELQLNAPAVSAKKYLSTSSQAINAASWEFKVRMTFGTSSSNFTKVYLVSNTTNLSGSLNGYYVMIGGTDDEVSLYKQSGTTTNEIIDGRNSVVGGSTVDVKIRVTRSSSGFWEVFSDTSSTSTFISEGTATDITHSQSLFFGVECNFTSTRSTRFYFDDFLVTGTAAVDTIKPELDSINVISSTQLELVFSEPVDAITSQNSVNYSVNNGLGNPSSAMQNSIDLRRVNLTFTTSFSLGLTNTLAINNVEDIAGNIINTTNKNFIYFIPATPAFREVVINEIFADPSPMLGLPGGEYVEIHNPTNKFFDLNSWQITDGSSTSTLPSYTLAPDSFVILYSASTSGDFSPYSNKLSLSSFPGLNNSGETITLLDDFGNTIDEVEYNTAMYQDLVKDDGGYSLEQINPIANCYNPSNWIASNNTNGGTPGTINSTYDTTPDYANPNILSSIASSNTTIQLQFDKSIDTATFIQDALMSDGRTIISYTPLNSFNTILEITISPALDTGKVYLILFDSLTDCEGNFSNTSSEIILPHQNKPGIIIINEILFNPFTGDEDFVELYNNSELYIDLKDWKLGNDDNGTVGNLKSINDHYILKPNEYVVITKDYQLITNRYPTHSTTNYIELESLPTYSNEEGTVYLLIPFGEESDKFIYHEDMHFALLRDVEGISIERLNFHKPTQSNDNWHSAAEEVGFATPGVENSQYTPEVKTEKVIAVSPEVFSPDNDGFEDVLTISYSMAEVGFVGNITLYDANGRKIKTLIQNTLLAKKGSFTWDGTTDENLKARIGRYIILFEYFDLEGNVNIEKIGCVVGHKL